MRFRHKRKITDPRISTLKKIEEDQEAAAEKARDLEKKRKDFLETLWANPIRVTKVTKKVSELFSIADKNPVVKLLLNAYGIPLKKIAIVDLWGEKYIGQKWDCPAHNSWDSIFLFACNWHASLRYLYGSPKDEVKLIFRQSANQRYYFCGFIVGSPMKVKGLPW